jgi:hypothetical protein
MNRTGETDDIKVLCHCQLSQAQNCVSGFISSTVSDLPYIFLSSAVTKTKVKQTSCVSLLIYLPLDFHNSLGIFNSFQHHLPHHPSSDRDYFGLLAVNATLYRAPSTILPCGGRPLSTRRRVICFLRNPPPPLVRSLISIGLGIGPGIFRSTPSVRSSVFFSRV